MAGSKVNDYAIGDQNIQSVMLTLDALFISYCSLTLTNYDNDSEPAIAAGSKVEINGSLYKFDSEESISGSESSGLNYIVLIPSGDSVTAEYTDTAPTWSDSKQGWYGTGDNANNRYIADFWYDSTNYAYKYIFGKIDSGKFHLRDIKIEIGTWNMDSSTYKEVTHSFSADVYSMIVGSRGLIISDDGTTLFNLSHVTYTPSSFGGGIQYYSYTNIIWVVRYTGGFFDSTSFDSTSFNRGYVILTLDYN